MTTKLSCTFTGTGTTPATGTNSASLNRGPFTVLISGAGTVALQWSADGSNWFTASMDSYGTPSSYVITAAATSGVAVVGENASDEMFWRFNVTAYTSTITCRLLQPGVVAS